MSLCDLSPANWGFRVLMGICLIGLAALSLGLRVPDADRASPRTLVEAATAAEARGLCWRSTAQDGSLNAGSIVVSTRPVTWEHTNGIRVNDAKHSCWHETIVIYSSGAQLLMNSDPSVSMVWGELFVYGDPRLIEKLTGRSLSNNGMKDQEDSRRVVNGE